MIGIIEAIRMLRRAHRVRRHGFRRFSGSPEQICRTILEEAYKKHGFFPVSLGHFSEFYTRDFALIAEDLVKLGYAEEVRATFNYALKHFKTAGKVGVMITPHGKVYDFPRPGPDSLALLLHAVCATGNAELLDRDFVQREIDRYVRMFVGKDLLPRPGRFSSIRDHSRRTGSCYDATMIAVVARSCEHLGLNFPASFEHIQALLKNTYWNGTYFFSDLHKDNIVIGDANVFPFWTGVISDPEMIRSSCAAVQAAGLDQNFPLRYVSTIDKKREQVSWHLASLFAPDYETDSIWAHLGLTYIRVLSSVDKAAARRHIAAYAKQIMIHRTFLELYANDGTPYRTPWYVSDEGMTWCASFLAMQKL